MTTTTAFDLFGGTATVNVDIRDEPGLARRVFVDLGDALLDRLGAADETARTSPYTAKDTP